MRHLVNERFVLYRLASPRAFAVRTGVPIERVVIRGVQSRSSYFNQFMFIMADIRFFSRYVRCEGCPTVCFQAFYRERVYFLMFGSVCVNV